TGEDEVSALKALLGDLPLRVNLIDVNDDRPDGFRRASEGELGALRDRLSALGVPVVRRYSGGKERHDAWGMLAATRFEGPPDGRPGGRGGVEHAAKKRAGADCGGPLDAGDGRAGASAQGAQQSIPGTNPRADAHRCF